MASKFIQSFRKFPKELFRVNNGNLVVPRTWTARRHVYDIVCEDGMVIPKALDPSNYVAPNGVSMRPNSPYQQSLVSWRFRGNDVVVFAVPKGTELPNDLLLVHERSDHYSLQPAAVMAFSHFSHRVNYLLEHNSRRFTAEDWRRKYPEATEHS